MVEIAAAIFVGWIGLSVLGMAIGFCGEMYELLKK